MPLVSHGLLKERCSFLVAQRYGACVSRVSLKIFTNLLLRVFISSASGSRLFSLRLRSDTKNGEG